MNISFIHNMNEVITKYKNEASTKIEEKLQFMFYQCSEKPKSITFRKITVYIRQTSVNLKKTNIFKYKPTSLFIDSYWN